MGKMNAMALDNQTIIENEWEQEQLETHRAKQMAKRQAMEQLKRDEKAAAEATRRREESCPHQRRHHDRHDGHVFLHDSRDGGQRVRQRGVRRAGVQRRRRGRCLRHDYQRDGERLGQLHDGKRHHDVHRHGHRQDYNDVSNGGI